VGVPRTRSAFDDDRTRATLLVANGWAVVRFTSRSTDAEIVGCVGRFGQLGAA
jgi:very-short-patch-repair endonuclease